MFQHAMESFVIGLMLAPACFLQCGVMHGVVLSRCVQGSRRGNLAVGGAILVGRLVAYVLVGVGAGLVAATGLFAGTALIWRLMLGLLLACYAILPARSGDSHRWCRAAVGRAAAGAFAVGFLTGLSPCPPFLGAVALAMQSHGVGGAVLTMVAFFGATSLLLLPLWLAPALVPGGWVARLRPCGRVLAGAMALYVLVPLVPGTHMPTGFRLGAGAGACPLATCDECKLLSACDAVDAPTESSPPQ